MFMNLSLVSLSILLVSLSMLDIFEIDVATVIFPVLYINFAKIYTVKEVVILVTLLFGRMLSLVKRFD